MSNITEKWKPVAGYEEYYWISDRGRLKNYKGNITIGSKNVRGYMGVTLFYKKKKQFVIHRLVAIAFLDNHSKKRTVNHLNGIRHDNRLENLEWATYSENTIHAYKHLNMVAGNKGKKRPLSAIKNQLKPVACDGVVYNSVKEASEAIGVSLNSIRSAINLYNGVYGSRRIGKKYYFEYVNQS